ncbi:hypothetical protein PsorP6_012103 [Peronosclerospora sorghi]|uniref:Uncharacterized protein n=1 Tax=Peronosclerospora sorghi TaxID=230839 RepID=A0ACC0WJX5_9STRA|nr:hypothetical protein PsorP6_012103 [Peronosclerospora sorghi]
MRRLTIRYDSPYTDDVVRLMEQKLAYTLSQITANHNSAWSRHTIVRAHCTKWFLIDLGTACHGNHFANRSAVLWRSAVLLDRVASNKDRVGCNSRVRCLRLGCPCNESRECSRLLRHACDVPHQVSAIIKPLAVTYSQFEQILMLDADTTYFVNPTVLFDSDKFQRTGILLMHDRISNDRWYMARRVAGKPERSVEQVYFATFDVTPFRPLPTLERPKASVENKMPVTLAFEPSDFLLRSHSFNLRAGHHVDSSLVLWDKHRQPRATAILASFLRHNEMLPPSYGDKELYFYASELADAVSFLGSCDRRRGDETDGRRAQEFNALW